MTLLPATPLRRTAIPTALAGAVVALQIVYPLTSGRGATGSASASSPSSRSPAWGTPP